jgi:hypothetical protein
MGTVEKLMKEAPRLMSLSIDNRTMFFDGDNFVVIEKEYRKRQKLIIEAPHFVEAIRHCDNRNSNL